MAKGKYEYWLTDEGLLQIGGWAKSGLTDEQIAHNMGICRDTLIQWKKKFPDISYLFPSLEISIMYAPAAFRHIHEKPLATAGIKHIQFHDLRDTFATLSLQNGVNVNNEV